MPGLLAAHVHVRDARGRNHVFGPDEEVPGWAAAAITNPKAWAAPPGAPAPQEDATPGAPPAPPPHTGAGSGRAPWAQYAAALGLTVPDGAGRDEIIALVEAAPEPQ
jgi:hypothetical protein